MFGISNFVKIICTILYKDYNGERHKRESANEHEHNQIRNDLDCEEWWVRWGTFLT